MRNRFPAICYVCEVKVAKGAGFFEKHHGKFRVRHVGCEFLGKADKPVSPDAFDKVD